MGDDDGNGAFAEQVEMRTNSRESGGHGIAKTQAGAGDFIGNRKSFAFEHRANAAPVAKHDVDLVAAHPARDHAAEGFYIEVVRKQERRHMTIGGDRRFLH